MAPYYVGKTIINLSSVTPTEAQCSLLSKGLGFCLTPGKPHQGDLCLWRDLHKFHRNLRITAAFDKLNPAEIEHSNYTSDINIVTDGFHQPSPIAWKPPFHDQRFTLPSKWNPTGPKILEHFIAQNELSFSKHKIRSCNIHNISSEERLALRELLNQENIIIKPADKGAAVVILNSSDYKTEALRQLSNTIYYKKIDQDLTKDFTREINSIVKRMFANGEIRSKTRDYLLNDSPRTSRFYMLPKIHKNKIPPPDRPIVSGNGCPTEKISEFVDFFLNPLVKQFPSYVKDTTHFLQKLKKVKKLPKGAFLFSLDVEALYTNIPHHLGLRFIKEALAKLRPGIQVPSNESILTLLEAILTKNNFTFNGEHFLQVAGTAMGTRTAPSYANLVLAIFELLYVYTYRFQPLCWDRFIDDIFGVWTHGIEEFHKFTTFLNTRIPQIKFTVDFSEKEVSFLDTRITLHTDGLISTSVYRKPTDTYNYILFSSAHPLHCKLGIPSSQFLRIRRICTFLSDFDIHSNQMSEAFLERGYPSKLVEQARLKARNLDRDTLLQERIPNNEKEKDDKAVFLIQTYCPDNNPLKDIITKNWQSISKNPYMKTFKNHKLVMGFRRPKNLRDILVRSKFTEKTKHPVKKLCWNTSKCRYCPKLNTTGVITSKSTGRKYIAKNNFTCQSNNLIYCIECLSCGIQYVGQTYRRIMDRFQGHFHSITNKRDAENTLINSHFNQRGHKGLDDISIYVLDFIHVSPTDSRAKSLRLKIEQNWIHRLRTVFPDGLNTET